MDPERKTLDLKHPFEFGGETVTELHIRRPKLRDMKRAAKVKDDLEKSVTMLADLAEVTPKLLEELDTEDFTRACDMLGEFMGVSAA